jgi:hypothetical protein
VYWWQKINQKDTEWGRPICFFSKTHMQHRVARQLNQEMLQKKTEHAETVATTGMTVGFSDCI